MYHRIVILLLAVFLSSASLAQEPVRLRKGWKPPPAFNEEDLVAPVFYRDPDYNAAKTMLVLSNGDGAAAIIFTGNLAEPGVKGVVYRYRYESFNGKTKQEGTGELFEQQNDEKTTGGIVQIDVVGLAIRWSPSDVHRGWIYYSPEKVRVNLADGRQFESRTLPSPSRPGVFTVIPAIDLQRFKPQSADK